MNKIISSIIISGLFIVVASSVFAATISVIISPASGNKNLVSPFNINVAIRTNGENVCVVKGTLSFSNLSCQTVNVASGLMAQKNPTCASPSFIIGIPKCTTANKNILSVSVKGDAEGQAKVDLTGVKVIGAGNILQSDSVGATYSITKVTSVSVEEAQPAEQNTENQVQPEVQPAAQNGLPKTAGAASLMTTIGKFVSNPITIAIVAVILILLFGLWISEKKFFKKNK